MSFRDFGPKVIGLSLNGFRQLWKIQFLCPEICFLGKKQCFISTGFWAKSFWLSSKKYKMVFETAFCVFRGRFWGKLFIVLKNKKNFLIFFWFFIVNWSEDLLKQHSKCPEDLLEGKSFLKKPHSRLSVFRLDEDHSCTFCKHFRWDCQNCFLYVQKNFFMKKVNSSVPYFAGHVQGLLARNKNYSEFFPKLHSACGERVWQKFSRIFFHFLSRVSKLGTGSAE